LATQLFHAFFSEILGEMRSGSCKILPNFTAATNTSLPATREKPGAMGKRWKYGESTHKYEKKYE
jgi:hypothetical protein